MTKSKKKAAPTVPRKGESKTDTVLALLCREGGATISDITGATGWQPHSARAVLTGFRKKAIVIDRAKVDGVTRYSITAEPAA